MKTQNAVLTLTVAGLIVALANPVLACGGRSYRSAHVERTISTPHTALRKKEAAPADASPAAELTTTGPGLAPSVQPQSESFRA